MTRDPEQDTADLRRDVRRLVESATAEQLKAMRDAFRRASPRLAELPAAVFGGCPHWPVDGNEGGHCGILDNPCPTHGPYVHGPWAKEATTPPEPIDFPPEKWRTESRQLQPGQRVTIPARYLDKLLPGVRLGEFVRYADGGMAEDSHGVVIVAGYGECAWVPIGEVEPA